MHTYIHNSVCVAFSDDDYFKNRIRRHWDISNDIHAQRTESTDSVKPISQEDQAYIKEHILATLVIAANVIQ